MLLFTAEKPRAVQLKTCFNQADRERHYLRRLSRLVISFFFGC